MSDSSSHAPPSENLVLLDSDSLIVGRTLRYPIYDDQGFLLLAEGMAITPEFRDKILERKIAALKVHPDEVLNISYSDQQDQMSFVAGDEALSKRLDEIIDEGFLTVVNSEPALIEQMTQHGTKNYNLQQHLERVERNRESSIFVDNLMRNALHGRNIDFSQVTRLTASYMADMTGDIDSSIASMVDTVSNDQIADHCVKMSLLGMALGVELRLDAPNVRNLGLSGLVHDWGMVRVPVEIRTAKRMLTTEERYQITKHPMYTVRMLEKLCGLPAVVPVVAYQVHESPNGQGYPRGRPRDRIHIMARILSVADRYDALVSPRPFRPPLTPYAAMECLLRQSATGDVDPDVVRALLMVQSLFPIGSYVMLSDGSMARVLRRNGEKFTQPIARRLRDGQGKEVPEQSEEAIVDLGAAGLEVVRSLPNPGSNAVNLSPEILRMSDSSPDCELQDTVGACLALAARTEASRAVPSAMSKWTAESMNSCEDYTESEKRRMLAALEILSGSAQLTDRAYQHLRTNHRVAVRTVATICLADPRSPIVSVNSGRLLRVLTSDISTDGASFICPDALPQDRILIGFHLRAGETKWFLGEVVRKREVADTSFWEHGLIFRQSIAI